MRNATNVTALLSAPLLAGSQLGPYGSYVALCALVPWLWAVRETSLARTLVLSAAVGISYGCIWAAWIPATLQNLGAPALAAFIGLAMAAAWVKVPLFVFTGVVIHASRTTSPLARIILPSLAFSFGEWVFGSLSGGIPVALLGHSQINALGVAQLAVVGGVPILSGWIAAINCAISQWLQGSAQSARASIALFTAWLVTMFFAMSVASMFRPDVDSEDPISLLLVQPDLPRGERWVEGMQHHNLNVVAEYTNRALGQQAVRPDAVIWPENMLTTALSPNSKQAAALQKWVDLWNTDLITGMVRPAVGTAEGLYRSSVIRVEPGRGIVDAIDKERAVPVVESSRTIVSPSTAERLFGAAARWPKVEEVTSSRPLGGNFELTPALCFEVLFASLVDKRRSKRARFILNLSDEGWMSSKALSHQLANIAAFRAIEQRLTLVRVAHGGVSAVTNPFGERTLELRTDEYAHEFVSIPLSALPSTSEKWGIASLPVGTGLIVYSLLGYSNRLRL